MSGRRQLAGEQRPRSTDHIILTHQAFSDQECRYPEQAKPGQIRRRGYAAFADDQAIFRNQRRQASLVASVVSKVLKFL